MRLKMRGLVEECDRDDACCELILVTQQCRATFCRKEWLMDHVNTPINEIVVMFYFKFFEKKN
jgi:hypothetical protein